MIKYDDIFGISKNLVAAKLNDKWGIINKIGEVVVPFEYENIDFFKEGLAKVKLNGNLGFIEVVEY